MSAVLTLPLRATPNSTAEMIYVGFIRAVMVGRDGLHRQVMLDAFEQSGATSPINYISTGNVSFEADAQKMTAMTEEIEQRLESIVQRRTEVFVRSLDELVAMAESEPFTGHPLTGSVAESVAFFYDKAPTDDLLPLVSKAGDVAVFGEDARHWYTVAKVENGLSRGSGGMIEKATGERVTSRAWSTIDRILTKLT